MSTDPGVPGSSGAFMGRDYGDAFAWPSRDPGWIGKLIVMGLIGFIPVIGQMNLLGWTLNALDNVRAGRLELPPANFSHLGRGAPLFLVQLVYGLVLALVAVIVFGLGIGLVSAGGHEGALAALGALLTGVGGLLIFGCFLLFQLMQPAIYLLTDRAGAGAGLDVPRVFDLVTGQFGKTVLAALLMYAASFIGGIGAILCGIGAVFTVPYGYAIVAGVLAIYERELAAPAAASV